MRRWFAGGVDGDDQRGDHRSEERPARRVHGPRAVIERQLHPSRRGGAQGGTRHPGVLLRRQLRGHGADRRGAGAGRARHRVRAAGAQPHRHGDADRRPGAAAAALVASDRAGLVPRQHPYPLRRKGTAARRPARAGGARARFLGHGGQRAAALGPRLRQQSLSDRRDDRPEHRPPRRRHRRGEPPQLPRPPGQAGAGDRLRPRDVPAHPQPGGAGQPRHADRQPRSRLSADLPRLRRRARPGRHRPLVPQRPRPGGAGGRRPGQAGRLQPVRSVLDGSRVRHLVPAAQLRHPAAGQHRVGLVRLLQQPRLRRHPAARGSTTTAGSTG